MKYCKDITELIEKSNVEKLSVSQKISIRFHVFICKTCKRYLSDSKALDILLKRQFTKMKSYSFSADEKETFKKSL